MGHVLPSRDLSLLLYPPCNGADITLSLVHAWYVLSFPIEVYLVGVLLPCQNYSCALSLSS